MLEYYKANVPLFQSYYFYTGGRSVMLKKLVMLGIVISGIMILLFTSFSCSNGYSGTPVPVSVGTTTSEVNSLILIAEEQGYFADNGLSVNHKIYSSGVAALDGMFNKEVIWLRARNLLLPVMSWPEKTSVL